MEGGELRVRLQPCLPSGGEAHGFSIPAEDGVEVTARDPKIDRGDRAAGKAGLAGLVWDFVHESEMLWACHPCVSRATVTGGNERTNISRLIPCKKKLLENCFPRALVD